MSNELTVTMSIRFSKGGAKYQKTFTDTIDVTGDAFTSGVQAIGTSEEEVAQGADLGTPGWVWIKNLDSTNYVEIGSTTGVYDIKLLAGEGCLYRHNSATVYAKANTAACNIEYVIIEL